MRAVSYRVVTSITRLATPLSFVGCNNQERKNRGNRGAEREGETERERDR